jgi:outer membrane protein assembly factor BamB
MRTLFPLLLLFQPALAQDWPNWRGPNHDGSSPVSGLPSTFDTKTGLRWVAQLPGPGASTPIVVGERVFLTSLAGDELMALCLDRETGEQRWAFAAGSGYTASDSGSTTKLHSRSNYASPSAVCDSRRVVFSFGNGDVVACDLEGEVLWRRNLQEDHGEFALQWTFSSSPTLWEGVLHLQILQRNEPVRGRGAKGGSSFLLGMDAATGETVYRAVRPSDAIMESRESYATPIPYVGAQGRKELLVMGGDVITGHDPRDGSELWRWGTWNPGHREPRWRVVPSPVVGGGVVLACGPKGAPVCAVKLGGEGELGEQGLAWQSPGRRSPATSDVPTPLFYQDAFFVLSDLRGTLCRVRASDGEILWTVELPRDVGRWRASPTGADGRVWILSHGGEVMLFDPGDGELLHRTNLAEEDADGIRSSIAVAHGAAFVRTNERLYCIGEAVGE